MFRNSFAQLGSFVWSGLLGRFLRKKQDKARRKGKQVASSMTATRVVEAQADQPRLTPFKNDRLLDPL